MITSKVGDKVQLNRNFAGISKGTVFLVVNTVSDNGWLHEETGTVNVHHLNTYYQAVFDLVEEEQKENDMKKPEDFFQVGDRVRCVKSIAGIRVGTLFDVVNYSVGKKSDQWICEIEGKIFLKGLRNQSDRFEIATDAKMPNEEKIVKKLPSWLKEAYYNHYIEIVTDFIKEYAKDHDISMTEGNETVLTATPRKKGN